MPYRYKTPQIASRKPQPIPSYPQKKDDIPLLTWKKFIFIPIGLIFAYVCDQLLSFCIAHTSIDMTFATFTMMFLWIIIAIIFCNSNIAIYSILILGNIFLFMIMSVFGYYDIPVILTKTVPFIFFFILCLYLKKIKITTVSIESCFFISISLFFECIFLAEIL